mmetsp:Transcript_26978/g.59303  ORF Transcript_26978/g.59303 Transcript_26978/m.59303 type:complete len:244 (-) Transcript_26978:1303-2034(-)|eukprot:CAMPEP_0168169372 /NCGR_PEP_ID=MMETSP0139_2-20121125/3602_1 /TAXON_ID=44445 /ORGANISM="Pseudo-nitzschia australis, Strain 10249 10 AB" /LENGTH=243 /DNA_ID=CAMNT_0008086785 /DNA_START=83 /DNA_END=817 /DNA_ORIENTATION=-
MKNSSSPIMLSRLFLLVLGSVYSIKHKVDALRPVDKSLFVVFGRPGSGKTTVANKAFDILSIEANNLSEKQACVALDLDVCVTQLMRHNFGKGIYPTLEERKVFAIDACDYVDDQLGKICETEDGPEEINVIISFSFVNTDLREIFMSRFPEAEWVLIDTSEEECTKRINEREGHFYKGEIDAEESKTDGSDKSVTADDGKDNSDWEFAPVTFPHVVLNGLNDIEDNAQKISEKILEKTASKQ